jgi:hypothetical protein
MTQAAGKARVVARVAPRGPVGTGRRAAVSIDAVLRDS